MGLPDTILGIIGNITATIMFISPLPTFWIIFKTKATGQFSAVPYLATLLNCLLWFFYGLPFVTKNNMLVLTINGIGIVLEGSYIMMFLIYSDVPGKMKMFKILGGISAFCGVIFAVTAAAFEGDDKATFLGSTCVVIGTMMYASPLSVMKLVIVTKSVEYMPFMLSFCSFINAILWTLYGILKKDKFIIIPNAMGVFLGAVQLLLYARYRKYPHESFSAVSEDGIPDHTVDIPSTDLSDIVTANAASQEPSSNVEMAKRVSRD